MFEVRLWVIPPVLKEVVGRYDTKEDALSRIKEVLKTGKTLDDVELYDNTEHKLLAVGVSEVTIHGKKTILNNY